MRIWHEFILAAGFLTRLAPARIVDVDTLGRGVRWFPLVGLYLGFVAALPFMLGLGEGRPWIQAWLWLGVTMVLTRGLHWDGWVDLCDAWGSGARGERFWEVLKDSRMGAFGGMGLVMGLAGYLVLLSEVFPHGAWGVLIWAPVLGRTAAVVLAWRTRALRRPGLAGIFSDAATGRRSLLVVGTALALGLAFVPVKTLVFGGLLCVAGMLFLVRLARFRGGVNGDFLGAVIVWGELSVFLGWSLGGT
ncbi:adenosylcobinamide-GDP ribazoletransferase [Desulfonatronum thiodismutans]|uniref:adenosylcobinamide-GDP ribazoletransferase n=1 Tax=Desulfonatronum thiodismutans TaxID=159290 RepID=UPI0004ABDC31|nr:adenosylcobinamide-GDP ribazoletransferase [Desulfonatronum thiodismutans]